MLIFYRKTGKEFMAKIRVERKTDVKVSIVRILIVLASICIQIWWITYLLLILYKESPWIRIAYALIPLMISLAVYGRHINASYKLPWLVIVLAFSPMGAVMYVIFGRKGAIDRQKREYRELDDLVKKLSVGNAEIIDKIKKDDSYVAASCSYIKSASGMPVWEHSSAEYYNDPTLGALAQVEELRKAESFIFMEYHAIQDGPGFDPFFNVLCEKARAGVEVRLIFDDVGSIMFINRDFINAMKEAGVQILDFNPISPLFHVFMNYRDHRKITVIDGRVAFTGGYNLADEYFHFTRPYGYWKDSGVKITGDAVLSFSIIFLEMWNYIKETDNQYTLEKYLGSTVSLPENDGFIQPYADSPMTEEPLAESVYLNIVRMAKNYCYFVTPYLIITDEFMRELTDAAKRGVDVRIITPGIPDKKLVYAETRSYYAPLVRSGVRIYEYTPGFAHAKMCISDDEKATVGSVNLDFRSLYLHFENGVFFYRTKMISEIYDDFMEMFDESEEVTEKYIAHRSIPVRIKHSLLRLVAPML